MDRATATALEKLSKGLVAIAESIAQLQLDVAKLDARVAAIDSQVVAIGKQLDSQLSQRAVDEKARRDLDLERAVFGTRSPETVSKGSEKGQGRTRKITARNRARKGTSKRLAGRGRR